ncbi:hypothetical protein [Marinicella meishanensis]|uniref:hypothetical protein n=1 Tax=Marinicella meishanensis TaxID=2873263 RepID=UPI001CBEF8D0|nr:hypothetical protein [Marinicella sp. NBU2979]
MTKLYTNKPRKDEPFNWKGFMFGIMILTFLILFFIAIYKSYGPRESKAIYNSSFVVQYANIYQLLSTVHHHPDEPQSKWIKKIQIIDLDNINDFCDVVENSIQKPVIDTYSDKYIKSEKISWHQTQKYISVITAVTEFECKERVP